MIKFSTTELLLPEDMVHYANVHHIVFALKKTVTIQKCNYMQQKLYTMQGISDEAPNKKTEL